MTSVSKHISDGYDSRVADLVSLLEKGEIPPGAKCIYRGRNTLYKIRHKGLEINIKSFKIPTFPNKYIYTNVRKSKARRSYELASLLASHGIPTPAPVAMVECKSGLRLTRSYYLSIQSDYPGNLRNWQDWTVDKRDKVLEAYARFMLQLHRAGILHHDLSPGNVLWRENPETAEIEFQLVDLNRMTVYDRPLTLEQAFTNFRNINLLAEETRRLGAIYGRVAAIDPGEAADRAEKALLKDQKRKRRLHKIKKIFRRNRRST